MPRSSATSVEAYLAELSPAQRDIVASVRELILQHLPHGYAETLAWGMLSYVIPLARYPNTYNGQPLGYVALAAQKDKCSLYLIGAYMDPARDRALRDAFAKEGLKLDMGKSCLRFKSLADLPLSALARTIAGMSVDEYIELYEKAHAPATRAATRKPAAAVEKKPAAKKSLAKKAPRNK